MDKFIDSLFYKNYILLKINIKNKIFIMAINSSTKFGVVYTTPEALANKLANDPSSLVSGKLYFAAGATSGAIGQGLYVYNDGSADGDSVGTVAMVGAGSVVDGNHAGLVSPDLLKRWNDASTTADLALVKANQAATALGNYAPKSHKHSFLDISTGGSTAGQILISKSDGTFELKTLSSQAVSNATNASTADVAKKVDSPLYIKVNNTQRIAYDAGDAKTLDISAGSNVSLSWDSSNSRVTIATTGVPTTTEMNTAISTAVSSLFKYVGDTSATPTSATVGQTWRASAAFTIAAANSVTGAAVSVEVGDVLLCTTAGPKFTVIQNNITNNVSFSETPTNQNLVMFDGATGQVKNSGIDVTVLNQTITSLGNTYAAKSHKHSYTDISAGTTANQILVSNSNGTFTLTNLSALKAGDASSADTADKVANTFDISVGGSDVLTFNGSTNKTIAFKGDGSTSVTHSNGVITISSTDTKYTHPALGTGTTAVDTSVIAAATPAHGGKFTIVTGALRDASGHITKVVTQQITLPGESDQSIFWETLS